MNIVSNLQFIIISSLIAFFLFTIIAIVFYKLGKREKAKIIQENNIIPKKENGIAMQLSRTADNKKTLEEDKKTTSNDDKSVNNNLTEGKEISQHDFSSKKIKGEKINNEINDNIESDKSSDYKFLKYTSNGYKPAIGDKDSRILRWR